MSEGEDYDPESVSSSFSPHYEPLVTLPEVKTETGEDDEDEVAKMRALLYKFNKATSEWKQRGRGDARFLKHRHTGKTRLILREEKTLALRMNCWIQADSVLTKPDESGDRSWTWFTTDSSDGSPQLVNFGIRFKSVEGANDFAAAFAAARGGSPSVAADSTSSRSEKPVPRKDSADQASKRKDSEADQAPKRKESAADKQPTRKDSAADKSSSKRKDSKADKHQPRKESVGQKSESKKNTSADIETVRQQSGADIDKFFQLVDECNRAYKARYPSQLRVWEGAEKDKKVDAVATDELKSANGKYQQLCQQRDDLEATLTAEWGDSIWRVRD